MAWLQPKFLLRVESLVITTGLLVLYGRVGSSWVLFFAAILVPDLSIFGYAAGPRVGAAIYNLAHTYSFAYDPGGVRLAGCSRPSRLHRRDLAHPHQRRSDARAGFEVPHSI